jgi:hypothetical protein
VTNEERVLNAHGRSQSSRPETTGPWAHARELRRFWAIARKAGVSKDGVHAIIEGHYPGKRRLHDLTRVEFIKVMDLLFHGPSSPSDTIPDLDIRHGACADGQWRKIRWLQRQLRWSDTHLINYVKKECGIHHVQFLTAWGARAVITGMEKIHERQP